MSEQSPDVLKFIAGIRAGMQDEAKVRALFLAGSHRRGTADAFSDLDFLAVAAPGDHAGVVLAWRRLLDGLADVVYWKEWGSRGRIVNAVTSDWLRCDLSVVAPDALAGRAQDRLRPLIDRDGLHASLPPSLPPKEPDGPRVLGIINEFIRVLGLLSVAMGRQEHYLGVVGVALLRDQLVKLMLEEVSDPDPGGALHLSRVLPPDLMQVLESLPFPAPVRSEVIDAHLAVAREFFPRARALAARLDLDWPEAFEAAARRQLERQLGGEADISW